MLFVDPTSFKFIILDRYFEFVPDYDEDCIARLFCQL